MTKPTKQRLISFLVLCVFLSCLLFFIFPSEVFAKQRRTVKVAVPISYGFAQYDDDGKLQGYDIEYANEIAQVSGMNIEIVPYELKNIIKIYEDLDSGAIDIASGNLITQAEYNYTLIKPNYAYMYGVIATNSTSQLNKYNFYNKKDFKIGIRGTSFRPAMRETLAELGMSQTDYEEVYGYNSVDEQIEAVKNGSVDAILLTSTANTLYTNNLKVLTKFDPRPFYFACNTENTELYNQFSSAIAEIQKSNRLNFETLENKYFPIVEDDLIFSDEEIEYIKQSPTLTALLPFDNTLLGREDDDMFKGINIELLNIFKKKTGIKIAYKIPKTYDDFTTIIKEKKTDIVGGINYDYNIANELKLTLSLPYASSLLGIYSIDNYGLELSFNDTIAVPYGINVPDFLKEYKQVQYNSTKECFDAVRKGKATVAIGNFYHFQYFINTIGNTKSYLTPINEYQVKPCFGLVNPASPTLISLFNKVMLSISQAEVNSIIMSNISDVKVAFSLKDFIIKNAVFLIIIFIVLIIILTAFFILYSLSKKRQALHAKRLSEEYKLQSELDGLTGIFNSLTLKTKIENMLRSDEFIKGALFIIDIDNFKQKNDSMGHLYGDKILVTLSSCLKNIASQGDIYGRYGGDEFVFFKNNISTEEEIAEFHKMLLAELEKHEQISLSIGGYVAMKQQNLDTTDLFLRADFALYDAKRSGKNRLELFSSEDFDIKFPKKINYCQQ